MIVYAVVDGALSPHFPLGVDLEAFHPPRGCERFSLEVRSEDPELASYLRIEERELGGGRLEVGARAGPKTSPPAP